MKLNGRDNIITDQDVTVTGNKNLGNSLRTVIDKLDDKVQTLEEQTKWIYANGGIGSGGGGGSVSKWQLKASLDNVELTTGGTIALSKGVGNYDLRIYTSGGSGTYSVTYTYGNNVSRTVTLNSDNGWSTVIQLYITENGRISVVASDGSIRREITGCNYIVIPYNFNKPGLYKDNGTPYPSTNTDIFIEDAKIEGINILATYAIAVDGEFSYAWYIDGIQQGEWQNITDQSGQLTYKFPDEFIVTENAALHTYELRVLAKPTGTLEPTLITNGSSFNLIPKTLYLKISTNEGQYIYDNPSILDPYTFATNTKIGLLLRIYNGPNATGQPAVISWTVYDEDGTIEYTDSKNTTDGVTNIVNVSFRNPGWNYVTFEYSLGGNVGIPVTKYFYCAEVQSTYNWFIEEHTPNQRRYYIAQAKSGETALEGITNIPTNPIPYYIEKKSSDTITSYHIDTYTQNDQLINIGIQYSNINNVQNPILVLYSDESKLQPAITLYQDRVEFDNRFNSWQKANIFLGKELEYDPDNREKYHLISINVASCFYTRESESGLDPNNTYYEVSIYIDGKLEGTCNTKYTVSPEMHYIDLYPGNYAINQFDFCSFSASDGNRIIYDSDVNWYWNSYKERIGKEVSAAETAILAELFDANNNNSPTFSIENELLKVNSAFPNNVALNTKVPVLLVTVPRDIVWQEGTTTIYNWMNHSYIDGEVGLNRVAIDIQQLEWSTGETDLKLINTPEGFNFGVNHFTLKLQGSSTMSNKSKNYTLAIKNDGGITEDETILFSPNYTQDDSSTFLPETAFTLKADVVDSSHSNNTAMGKFINENNTWDYRSMQKQTHAYPEILTHVKQCLEGFSFLMFMNVKYRENDGDHIDTYYLGIYNFNLGRDSYFNLGYCDLSQLNPDDLTSAKTNGFTFCKVGGEGKSGISTLNGFLAAEVQDNSPYWDFSQYDTTVLFPLPGTTETGGFMFGDIVDSPMSTQYTEGTIKNFVRSVAAGGGYLFNTIGKTFVGCKETYTDESGSEKPKAYHLPNNVSDYKIQYVRTRTGVDSEFTPGTGDLPTVLDEGAITSCVLDDLENNHVAPLDYPSLVYYYTTCMTFGLVDSVQKNLNIKTWNANVNGENTKMGLFFYDMDTCLGKTNAGGKTSYFAFSDFWKTRITRYGYNQENELVPLSDDDTTTPVVKIVNDGTDIYRDCFLFDSNVTGYDTPSSYLFAIAKYAATINSITERYGTIYPQNIYAIWRKEGNVLETADKFIEKYFASNLKDIPDCLINLNYRNKYLYDYKVHSSSFIISESLHGIGIEETTDWLRGRLHILDAYFNLLNAQIVIYNNIPEPQHQQSLNNKDIYIRSDIFSNNNQPVGRKIPMTFTVNAADYSPLCVRLGNDYLWYLFEDSTVNYETNIPISGVLQTTFGGSQLWRKINSINAFVESRDQTGLAFIFNTDTIDELIGTNGTQTGNWSLVAPALKTIQLTSPNYAGTLKIDNNFPSISSINISNSSISLDIENDNIRTIDASNLRNSSSVKIMNCRNLTANSVNLDNSNINECTIAPAWQDDLNFSNVNVKQLTITAPTTDGTLTISNNSSITTLSFANIKNLNISNCPNLTTVTCTDTNLNILQTAVIKSCPSLENLTLKSSIITKLDVSNDTKLEVINITTTNHGLEHLEILDAKNTKLKGISKTTYGNPVYNNGNGDGEFDFQDMPQLSDYDISTAYLDLSGNTNLVSIQFYCLNGSKVLLRKNFSGCKNLERIYGNVGIGIRQCFYNCGKFSIFGDNLNSVRFANKKVYSGGSTVYSGSKVLHPYTLLNSTSIPMVYTAGNTFMWLSNAVSNLSYTFAGTSCTVFDIYYILCSNNGGLYGDLSYLFYDNVNPNGHGQFWYENSPDTKMFIKCSNVTNLASAFAFKNSISSNIKLFSPTIVDGEFQDDGLFSPLIRCTSITSIFFGYTVYADRFLFRQNRQPDESYAITNLNRFNIKRIVDNIYSVSSISQTDFDNDGNLTDFFYNLPNLSENLWGFLNGVDYIKFDTISGIPDAITDMRRCFNSTYGTGEINLNNYFTTSTQLTNMYGCFTTSTLINRESNTCPEMLLTNNTFERFYPRSNPAYNGIENIGYYYYASNASYSSPDPLSASFSGVIKKRIEGSFPFDIFAQLPNLKMAVGIFRNAYSTSPISDLKLPGNLFRYNYQLENCAAEFYDINIPYTISETYDISYNPTTPNVEEQNIIPDFDTSNKFANFVYCENLKNVSYLFGESTGFYTPSLSGEISRNLFFHGGHADVVKIIGSMDGQTAEEPIYVMKIYPNRTIEDMKYCFSHCNCDAYTFDINPIISAQININAVEPNPDYSPYPYIKNTSGQFIQNLNIDTCKYTSQWTYDGYTHCEQFQHPDIKFLDFVDWTEEYAGDARYIPITSEWMGTYDIQPTITGKFICPPDLFRFSTDKCNITYMFYYAGVPYMSQSQFPEDVSIENRNKYAYGITGRICPYLLYPVKDIDSIDGMFSACKCLSFVSDLKENIDYLIGDNFFNNTTKIKNFRYLFTRNIIPHNVSINLKNAFSIMQRESMNLQSIFDLCYWSGRNGDPTIIDGIFDTNTISNVSYAFRGNTSTDTSSSYPYSQYVKFKNIYKPNTYNKSRYEGKSEYSYGFYGWGSNADLTDEHSLTTNNSNHNYDRTI